MIDLSEFFPAGVDLKTERRKALYVDILKVTEHCFANMPNSFAQAFKSLFLKESWRAMAVSMAWKFSIYV